MEFISRVNYFSGFVALCLAIGWIISWSLYYPPVFKIYGKLHLDNQFRLTMLFTFLVMLYFVGVGKINVTYW